MKICLTGTTGFIGHHLLKRLAAQGHELCSIVRSTSNRDDLQEGAIFTYDGQVEQLIEFMTDQQFDGIVHLASLFLSHHHSSQIKSLIDSNILFSTSLLEASVHANVKWFVNTGTFWQHYDDAAYSPVNLYAATKQAFMDIARYYIETTDINFVTLKLNDTFGPGDKRKKILNLWFETARSGQSLSMSPGDQYMDISYIDNVIDAYMILIALLDQDQTGHHAGKSFGVYSHQPMTLNQLSRLFEEVTHLKLSIHWGDRPYRSREVMHPCSRLPQVPGWSPKITLEEGIKRTFM